MLDKTGRKSGTRILVLEAAGVKCLSSLKVLGEIMKRVQEEEGLDEPPDPNEWFEFVVGTDTTAFTVALMGRLRMSIDQTIVAFQKLSKEVFSDKKVISRGVRTTEYKTSKLKQTLKDIVREKTGSENEMMIEKFDHKCKTMIFAMSKHNMNAGIPTIFRSYRVTTNQTPDCTIWEAICASTAYPGQFKSIDIGEPPMRESFVAGALGCANPAIHVLEEVKRMCPGEHVATIVCIGAGHPRTIQISEQSPLHRMIVPLNPTFVATSIVRDSERVAHEMAVRFRSTTGVYFRLSVDQGMQEVKMDNWDQMKEVVAHTGAYMRQPQTNTTIGQIVKSIRERKGVIPTIHIDGQIQLPSVLQILSVKQFPEPTATFTGRNDKIEQIKSCILKGDKERRIFVIHGLGGAGKTQTALKTVEKTRDMWTEIVFVDATSQESVTSALENFARTKKIGETCKEAIRWLGSHRERWMMVFDNVDDPSLDIRSFFPSGNHGSIIVTTRLPSLALLASGLNADCKLSGMAADEAMDLLTKTARMGENSLSDAEYDIASQLLQEFGYLALAIVHAGAYIWCSQCSISQYKALFFNQRQATLEKYHDILVKVDNYQKSVYTTWYMSYQQLSTGAKQTLWLMAFMHCENITEDIFRRAALNQQSYKPITTATEAESEAQEYMNSYLGSFLNSAGAWDSGAFLGVMAELISYSLIDYDRSNSTYSLHVLVHDWASTVTPDPMGTGVQRTAFLLAVSINYGGSSKDYIFKRELEAHVSKLLGHLIQPMSNYGLFFAEVYRCTGRWDRKQALEVAVVNARKQELGDEHPDTLTSMNDLASTYDHLGQYKQAKALYLQVLCARKRVLGDEHLDTLTSMIDVASTYQKLGQYKLAEVLQVQALKVRKRILGDADPDTLTAMCFLASTYQYMGHYKRAKALQAQVLESYRRMLGDEHPDTLSIASSLASTYRHSGMYEQAEALHLQVLETRKRVLGNEHPDTLTSMSNLAHTYQDLNQYEQAQALQVDALKAYRRVLGDEHPHTITSMSNLGYTYRHMGRYEEAEALNAQALEIRTRLLGDEHIDTLSSMSNLASTYQDLGQYERAKILHLQVLEARKRVLGDDHPFTLIGMFNLASIYQDLGRYKQAQVLHMQALEARSRILGDDHPATLSSMSSLASTYRDLDQYEPAAALHSQVLEIRKRVFGDEHSYTLTSMSNLAATYQDLGQHERAEALQTKVLESNKRVLGDEHSDTLNSMSYLSTTCHCLGQYERAEALQLQVMKGRQQLFGFRHPETLGSMHHLAATYLSLGEARANQYKELQNQISGLEG